MERRREVNVWQESGVVRVVAGSEKMGIKGRRVQEVQIETEI